MESFFGGPLLILIFFSSEIETASRPQKSYSRGLRRSKFQLPLKVDPTGESSYHLFLEHYRERGLPSAPDATLKLYEKRHAGGSYYLPEIFTSGRISERVEECRDRTLRQNLVKPEHQHMYQQLQDLQDHSRGSGSSSRRADHRYQNQYAVEDQPGGYVSGSGNKKQFPAPPMTPSEDLYANFDIQPPKHLDFEEISLQNNHTTTVLIDNYNIHLRDKYKDHSKGSSSV